jgi:DNA-binding transcriptional MerR regulator
MKQRPAELLGPSEAASILGVTAWSVWWLAKHGKLPVAARTPSGRYLYGRADVERLARERQRRRAS